MLLIHKIAIAPSLNILAHRRSLFGFSGFLMVLSVVLLATFGLNFGVDFRGGIELEVRVVEGRDIGNLRDRTGGLGLGEITLQEFGDPRNILINVERQPGDDAAQFEALKVLEAAINDQVEEYRSKGIVGPKVGEELKRAGIWATVLAILGIGAYIWFRFEWQFSLAAITALAHDVVATIGFFSLTQIEFNLATLAAVLTVAGYSINDTVVIFDRVREMLRKYKKLAIIEVLNLSINRTLSRTILTSVTTLLALTALSVFGGEVIRGFSLGLIWGVAIGTYSSVGLAVPLLTLFQLRSTKPAAGGDASADSAGVDKAGGEAAPEAG